MPRKAAELMPLQVRRLTGDGMHSVGGVAGLYLQIAGTSRSWILRTVVGNKRRNIGLGGFPDVELGQARAKARALRARITDEGIDPVEERRRLKAALCAPGPLTFDEACARYIRAKSGEWANAKHAEQWRTTLATYAGPIIGRMPVDTIELVHVMGVLEPIWATKTETATRLRGRIESVLAWATVNGHRKGDNPARWRGNLDHALPKPTKVTKKKNQPALPFDDMPRFMRDLRGRCGASLALEFLILTAGRSGEVRGARWPEIDLDAALWTVPAERMKARRPHVVPLPDEAVALLRKAPRYAGTDLIFPNSKAEALSDATMAKVVRLMDEADKAAGGTGYMDPKMGRVAVPHGFRSTFKDWAAERTNYPNEVSEAALAHINGDKTEAAYRRGDLLEKRRALMADWARFVGQQPSANVTPIRRKA